MLIVKISDFGHSTLTLPTGETLSARGKSYDPLVDLQSIANCLRSLKTADLTAEQSSNRRRLLSAMTRALPTEEAGHLLQLLHHPALSSLQIPPTDDFVPIKNKIK